MKIVNNAVGLLMAIIPQMPNASIIHAAKEAIGSRNLVSIFILYIVLSWVSSTLSWAQTIPPIPTTPPVQFQYIIPTQPLDQLFGRPPDLQGTNAIQVYLNLSAPQGSNAGDTDTTFRITVTSGVTTSVPVNRGIRTTLLIDGKPIADCSAIPATAGPKSFSALCSFDESYLFSVGSHEIRVITALIVVDPQGRTGVVDSCGSTGREPCQVEKTANFGVLEPTVNRLRLSQTCEPGASLVGESVTCTAIVDNLRHSTAATISNVRLNYNILSEDVNPTDYSVEVKRVLVNSDLPNPDIDTTNCTKTVPGFSCRLVSEDEPLFTNATVIFNITSSKVGDFRTTFHASASGVTEIVPTNPIDSSSFDGIPFQVVERENVNAFLRDGLVFTAIERSVPGNDPHGLCRETNPNDRTTWRIFAINPEFTNISGVNLRVLQYVVRTLSGGNTLINADDAPPAGGVGSTVTLPESALGPDGILSPGEFFHDLSNTGEASFFICLASRDPFEFFIDVLGIPGP